MVEIEMRPTIRDGDNCNPINERNFNSTTNRQSKRLSLLQRLTLSLPRSNKQSTIADSQLIKRQFDELFNEPISNQDRRRFRQYFGRDISEKTFTVDEFNHLFQVGPTLGRRLLLVFNQKQAYETDSISGSVVIRVIRILWNYLTSVKALILFKLFDENNDDKVSMDEIRTFYQKYLSEFRIFQDQEQLKEVVDIFLKGFFPINNDTQEINFDQFYEILKQNPDVFKSLYLITIPDQGEEDEKNFIWYQRWCTYVKNNANRIGFLILYILSIISLIIYRVFTLKNETIWYMIARVSGILINFNFAVAISLMLKQTMTIIRRIYYLRLLIPVDDHIDAHRLVGTMLSISALTHTIGHTVQFVTHTDKYSWIESMFTTSAGIGWIGHLAPITGDILVVLLMIMFIFSLQCIRQRSGFYRLFHYTHLLFWPMFILLVIHAQNFWKWAIGPMLLLFLEKIYLLKRYSAKYGRTRLLLVRIEDKNVLTLIIERPKCFTFYTGDYINICFPNIANMQWHPFTIPSGPERKDIIRINIMKKKIWTKKVYDHFYKRLKNLNNNSNLTEVTTDTAASSQPDLNSKDILLPKEIQFSDDDKDAIICIEGPFSSCTSYVFDCEHVVLIGAGIGITPSISALDSLSHQLKEQRYICSHCGALNIKQEKLSYRKLKKVDFIWINRDIGNVSWFRNILDGFEAEQECYLNAIPSSTTNPQEQQPRYLDIHLYCTSLRSNEQALLGNLPYDLVANMYAAMQQKDMHTHLRTRTHVGRPPWKLLFAKFKTEHQSTNVFFTGNITAGNEIKRYCDELGFSFRREPGF